MSDAKGRLLWYFKRVGAGSMLVSIVLHVLVAILATIWVFTSSAPPKRKAVFQGGGSSSAGVQHAVQMARVQPSLDVLAKRLSVDTPTAAVSLSDMPPLPSVSLGGPSLPASLGKGMGIGDGVGKGAGLGSLKGAIMPAFGFKDAVAGGSLTGAFYDFKQLRNGTPNPAYHGNLNNPTDNPSGAFDFECIRAFMKARWAPKALNKYYRAPTALHVTQISIPRMEADQAPKAYGVAGKVRPKAWMALYQGRVSPPQSGKYRFAGGGDDLLIVRFNGKVVLDAGITNLSGLKPVRKYPGRVSVGETLDLNANQFYDIQIIVSEGPGKGFFALLLFEQDGVKYKQTAQGVPILPIFRVADTRPAKGSLPPHMPDGPVWLVQPSPEK